MKRGTLQLDPGAGTLTGEIVVDAKSGDTGSKMRDGKMHREVLESEQYPEITFRPTAWKELSAQKENPR